MTDDLIDTSISVTRELYIQGWSHLDAVILASLATEAPLLLVGPHGTGKTFLFECISKTLNLEKRHYNASLISYDDLVGIPMVDSDGKSMYFVDSPVTVWNAEMIFFDEISRCRPDLQNKLYPIIHERRVLGIKLDKLRYRWAAMNPPAPEDPAGNASQNEYFIGSEPLDPALRDRFPYVVLVPTWEDLSKEERYAVIEERNSIRNRQDTQAAPQINLMNLIEQCNRLIPEVEAQFTEWLSDYIVSLMDLLEQAQMKQTTRRAEMLADSIVALHAARVVLEGPEADVETSVQTALVYGIPQTATETPPSQIKLISLHHQAWEMTQYLEDDHWRQVMQEYDLARRVVMADHLEFNDEDMSRLITQTLSAEDSDARQWGLATAMFLSFRQRRNLDPSAYEPLVQLAYHVLEPRLIFKSIPNNSPELALWNEIKQWIENQHGREESYIFWLERNYLLAGFEGQLWRSYDWKKCLEQFHYDLILFGIEEQE